jgi:peptide/nickel transport system substrate-binding protein
MTYDIGVQSIMQRIHTRRQFLQRSLGAGAAVGASSLVLPRIVEAKTEGNTLVVAHVEEVGTLDPKVWGGFAAIYVQTQIYDTLIRQDPVTGVLQPSLAVSWENPDPLTYRYTLREGAKFHNGAPVTAEDVAFTFNRIADPKEGAWELYMFVNVDEAVALDDLTIEVRMKQPDHQFQFIGYFEGGNICNKAHVQELGGGIGTNPVGAGPYRFIDRDPSRVVLEAFEDYYEGKPAIERIEFRNIKDATTIVAGLRSGDIHLSYDVPRDQAVILERSDDVTIQTAPGWEHTLLHLANQKPPFNDVKVRQALRYAIDPGAALAAFSKKYIEPAYGAFIPPNVPFSAHDETEGGYTPDIEKAKALMAESSMPDGFAANMAVNPGVRYEALALAIQQQVKPLGIDLTIQRLPAPDTIALAYSHDFDAILMYWISDYTDISSFLLQWYGPNGGEFGPNFTEHADAAYDKLFETSLYTTDEAERAEAFKECQRILTERQPSLCLAFPQTVRFQSARLTGAPVLPVYVYDRYADIAFSG